MVGKFVPSAPSKRLAAPATLAGILADRLAVRPDTPDTIAVVGQDCGEPIELCRGELDSMTMDVARRLSACGAGPDRIVALLLDRTVHLPVAVFGVLRAGAAYLPLSVEDPDSRIAALLADAAPVAVLTTSSLRHRLPADLSCLVIEVDHPEQPRPGRDLQTPRPCDLAYVIYTSGSTGMPKGVLTEHHAIVNRLLWMGRALNITEHDVILQKTPCTFDVSVWELLLPLVTGARMVLAPPGGHRDAEVIADCIEGHRVTVLHFVPTMLADFIDLHPASRCASLKRVVSSGEALSPQLVARFYREFPDVELHNMYGPTEAAVDVTHWHCNPAAQPGQDVPIGFPITGAELSVRDDQLRRLDPGMVGELCIGGPAVARGYLNRPELTARLFLPDPDSDEPYARLYRTGDLASRRADGAYLYHGRRDDQIKLGGVRIELGEVERAIERAPGVRRAAAAVRPDASGDDALVGWAVMAPGHDVKDVREHLCGVLPPALVPAAIVAAEQMPTSVHGKVDRAKLEWSSGTTQITDESLRNGLRNAWVAVFGSDPELATDFLAFGGNSLQAVRLLARVRAATGVRLGVRELMARPRFADLVEAVESRLGEAEHEGNRDQLPRLGDTDRLPVSPAQRRMWFLQQLEPESVAQNIVGGLVLTGVIDVSTVRRCLHQLVEAHEVLRTTFSVDDEGPYVVVGVAAPIDMPTFDLTGLDDLDQAVRAHLIDNAATPFNLATGPLWRARLLRLGPARHVLALAVHHVVTDGWSWSVLAADFLAAWEHNPVPSVAGARYVDYAEWERCRDGDPGLARQLEHWREVLVDPPPPLRFSVGHCGAAGLSAAAHCCDIPWPAGFPEALNRFCAARKTTPFAVFLAGYAVLIARLTDQDEVLIAAPVANRNRLELESVVGCFLNTIALRLEVDGATTFARFLEAVDATLLDALANAEVPFDRVVSALDDARGDIRSSLTGSLLVVQNTPAWSARSAGRQVQVIELPSAQTHYDLKLEIFTQQPTMPARLVHRVDLFSVDRGHSTAAQYAGLLSRVIADPDLAVSRYSLVDDRSLAPTTFEEIR